MTQAHSQGPHLPHHQGCSSISTPAAASWHPKLPALCCCSARVPESSVLPIAGSPEPLPPTPSLESLSPFPPVAPAQSRSQAREPV